MKIPTKLIQRRVVSIIALGVSGIKEVMSNAVDFFPAIPGRPERFCWHL
jgi:hypothetical protein